MTVDLDERGTVQRVEAITPPAPPPGTHVRAILVDSGGGRVRVADRTGDPDPLFDRAAEACARRMRFAPAELHGAPVAFRGFRMTIGFSDPQHSEP